MKFLIDEEFGYRYWEWIPRGTTKEEVIEQWRNIHPADFADIIRDITTIPGMWRELRPTLDAEDRFFSETLNRDNYDGHGHVHEFFDSYLFVDGREILFERTLLEQ